MNVRIYSNSFNNYKMMNKNSIDFNSTANCRPVMISSTSVKVPQTDNNTQKGKK